MKKKMKLEIVKHIGVIRDCGYPVELNVARWNDGKPVFDLRRWKIADDGGRMPLKGLALDQTELRTLRDILNNTEELKDE